MTFYVDGMVIHPDPIYIKFTGQGHNSKFQDPSRLEFQTVK